MKKIISLAAFVLFATLVQAQTQTYTNTDPKTGVKVSTKITPLVSDAVETETLPAQIANLERLHQNALQNPSLVADGTAAKYATVLAQKRSELAAKQAAPLNNPNVKNQPARKSLVPSEKGLK
jgi:hypothetical protein